MRISLHELCALQMSAMMIATVCVMTRAVCETHLCSAKGIPVSGMARAAPTLPDSGLSLKNTYARLVCAVECWWTLDVCSLNACDLVWTAW